MIFVYTTALLILRNKISEDINQEHYNDENFRKCGKDLIRSKYFEKEMKTCDICLTAKKTLYHKNKEK